MSRKKTEELCLKYIGKIGNRRDVERYKNLFKSMNNKDFDSFMKMLKANKTTLRVIEPNGSDSVPDIAYYFKIMRELGYEPFQRVKEKIPGTDIYTYSNVKDLCLYVPAKRLSQHTIKKMSIPKHSKSRDSLTGQVTNTSRATKITQKELGIFKANGYNAAVKELMMARTGDSGGETALFAFIEKYGEVSLDEISRYREGRQSTKSLNAYFKAMHLDLKL